MDPVFKPFFDISSSVRYVAIYRSGKLMSAQRPGISAASASESDKYEELLVNPTLIKLVSQRGKIDCGGLEFVLIRYGHFFEFVYPAPDGHFSIGIEVDADVLQIVGRLSEMINRTFLL